MVAPMSSGAAASSATLSSTDDPSAKNLQPPTHFDGGMDQARMAFDRLTMKEGEARSKNPVKRLVRFFWGILKYHFAPIVLIALFISALSLFLCSPRVLNLRAELAVSPIFTGFIFPLTFMMSATWSRRESARVQLSSVRTACFVVRWSIAEYFSWIPKSANVDIEGHMQLVDRCLKNILIQLMQYLQHEHGKRDILAFTRLHSEIRTLTHLVERSSQTLIANMSPAPSCIFIHGAVGKIHENVNFLRGVKDTKTPWGLTVFGWIGVLVSPVLLAPHFAQIGCSTSLMDAEEECGFGRASSYNSGLFYAFIVASLFKIVRDLEDPFDGLGRDDLALLAGYTDYRTLVDVTPREPPHHELHSHEDKKNDEHPSMARKITSALFVT